MVNERKLEIAAEIIVSSENIVAFTGAGASTESGIADFRSKDGLWSKYDPSIYASYHYFLEDPSKFWVMHNELTEKLENAEPNHVHYGIAGLEKLNKMTAIITQNVDMLHQKAGSGDYDNIPIYELHGSYGKLECIKCHKEFEYEEVDTKSVKYPVCDCSGFIKPKVILFGESLPPGILESAINAIMLSDCFLMIGSSLLISPANLLPQLAKENGAKTIFINRENTMRDDLADIFLRGYAGKIFQELLKKIHIKL
ncbi:MAG: NAD-dependent protein deacylase [Candidatus Lokiarchaeota archaeon]|nr:NAD-dependent protein deacylase [Candidatus Lokiarchaeota archaeon]MBD3198625.1 NAD-dependent protein deacylase [Candidatus Lokiarchaeota archaeon]